MQVFERRLKPTPDLLGAGSTFGDSRGNQVVCASWLWEYTNLPHDLDFIHICIAAHYVRDAFRIRLNGSLVYIDKERAFTPSYIAFYHLIRRHGREIGQSKWLAWVWFEYTP